MVDEPEETTDDVPEADTPEETPVLPVVMERVAVIDPATGVVVTITDRDANGDWDPDAHIVPVSETIQSGDLYDMEAGTWSRPVPTIDTAVASVQPSALLAALVETGVLSDEKLAALLGDETGTTYQVVDGTLTRTDG